MSSQSSSSSGTAGRRQSSSLRLPRRSTVLQWGAAAVTAVALYGFPFALVASIGAAGAWIALLVVDVLVLVAIAIFLWSPLVVLAAAIVSSVFAVIFWFVVGAFDTCGTSTAAGAVEAAGGAAIAIGIGAWGVHRGPRMLWAMPIGWVLAGAWIAAWAHLIPGGAGGCFE